MYPLGKWGSAPSGRGARALWELERKSDDRGDDRGDDDHELKIAIRLKFASVASTESPTVRAERPVQRRLDAVSSNRAQGLCGHKRPIGTRHVRKEHVCGDADCRVRFGDVMGKD